MVGADLQQIATDDRPCLHCPQTKEDPCPTAQKKQTPWAHPILAQRKNAVTHILIRKARHQPNAAENEISIPPCQGTKPAQALPPYRSGGPLRTLSLRGSHANPPDADRTGSETADKAAQAQAPWRYFRNGPPSFHHLMTPGRAKILQSPPGSYRFQTRLNRPLITPHKGTSLSESFDGDGAQAGQFCGPIRMQGPKSADPPAP